MLQFPTISIALYTTYYLLYAFVIVYPTYLLNDHDFPYVQQHGRPCEEQSDGLRSHVGQQFILPLPVSA